MMDGTGFVCLSGFKGDIFNVLESKTKEVEESGLANNNWIDGIAI